MLANAILPTLTKEQVLKFREVYKMQDIFFGLSGGDPDPEGALKFAAESETDDAKWLVSAFPNGFPSDPQKRWTQLMSQGETGISLCFAAFMFPLNVDNGSSKPNPEYLRRSAKLGYPLAESLHRNFTHESEWKVWRERAANQSEPRATCEIGLRLLEEGTRNDALLWLDRAGDLGLSEAQYFCAGLYETNDQQRYKYLRKALENGLPWVGNIIELCKGARPEFLFQIGGGLAGYPNKDRVSGFWNRNVSDLVQVYEHTCVRANEATWCWIIIGRRLGLCEEMLCHIVQFLSTAAWAESGLQQQVRVRYAKQLK